MKKLLFILVCGVSMTACKQSDVKSEVLAPTETNIAKEGTGKIELQCGSQKVTIDGKCGGVTNTGEMILAVQDKTIPAKVFTICFNTKDYPENEKIYTVKKSDFGSEGKKPLNEIYVGFSQITEKEQADWSSDDAAGTMQFQVKGNEISCKFSGIKLLPSIVYNKAELNQSATVSGVMTFYKN